MIDDKVKVGPLNRGFWISSNCWFIFKQFLTPLPKLCSKKQCSAFYFDTDESAESKQVMKNKFVNSRYIDENLELTTR